MQAWQPAPAPKLLHVPDQPTMEVLSPELLWSGPGDSGHCSPFPPCPLSAKDKDNHRLLLESWLPPGSLAGYV